MSTSPFRLTAIVAGAVLAVTVAACGGPAGTGGGAPSCAGGSRWATARFAAARLVFTGIMLPGPSAGTGQGTVLASPARVRVVRYLKGSGPAMVTVSTAVTRTGGGDVVANAEGIQPRVGERWTIYTASRSMPYQTSVCGGSTQASSGP